MEDENIIPSASRASSVSEKPLKRRRSIVKHHPLVSVDFPLIVFANILSRLTLDDIFINFSMVCKSITALITEAIVEHTHYFTKIYRRNYHGMYFLFTKPPVLFGRVCTYFGEVRKAEELDRKPIFWENKFGYEFATTRWTRQKLICPVYDIKMTQYVGSGRCGIVSCNGILCIRVNSNMWKKSHILVTNPIFGHEDDEYISEPTHRILESSSSAPYIYYPKKLELMGSSMGFGCTRSNSNKFKILVVKNYAYTSVSDKYTRACCEPCVKSTCEIRTLGSDQDWRVLNEKMCWFRCCHTSTFVTLDGTFYWIGHCSPSRCVCVAFDIEEENARDIELPPQFKHIDDYYGGLVIMRHNLYLYDNRTNRDNIIIWKMVKDTINEHSSWRVEFIIDKGTLYTSRTRVPYEKAYFVPVTMMPTGEIMMFSPHLRASCIYDPSTRVKPYYIGSKTPYYTRAGRLSKMDQAIPYMPNFASLKDVIKRGIAPKDA